MDNGVKVFHLTAAPVKREFAPGMVVNCWGYNGSTPGPTIEAVEGDRVRILVTNKLPEHTTIHWHGIFTPNGMDGVGGLTQPLIQPGETYVYEFTLRQNGTFMYHPHGDEMVQMALGMMGMFVIHPKTPENPRIDRDYCILLHNFAVHAGTARPDPSIMVEFNMWSFNSRVFPGTDPLVARVGDRVRIRIANLSMWNHPIHVHGTAFEVTGTDSGWIPPSARYRETTMLVPVGNIRVGEFIAQEPGDWALHCHMSHHTMNAMGHGIPNMIGVNQKDLAPRIRNLVPGYMSMGESGMADMADMQMPLPENTLPMMTGQGPFGPIEMGGMFTVIKVRKELAAGDYSDPGWYEHPPGTVAWKLGG
jgi:FtsP/CotA-like multicopper oxidase with cupredoxin domain